MTNSKPGPAWRDFIQKAGGHSNAKLLIQQVMEMQTRVFCHKNGIKNADEWIEVLRKSW